MFEEHRPSHSSAARGRATAFEVAATNGRACTAHPLKPVSPVLDDEPPRRLTYRRNRSAENRLLPSAHITTIDDAAVSEDAYLLAYPLVLAELTRVDMTSVSAAAPIRACTVNELVHARRRPDARVRTSVGAPAR